MTVISSEAVGNPEANRAGLRLVPPLEPESVVVPYAPESLSEGQLAIAIGELATHIKENYQSGMGVQNFDEYDDKRRQKRLEAAVLIFRKFGMLQGIVEVSDTADEDTKASAGEANLQIETEFGELYKDAEKQVTEMISTDRTSLVDLVDKHFEHPVVRTTLAVKKTMPQGPAGDDILTVQRASVLLIEGDQPTD